MQADPKHLTVHAVGPIRAAEQGTEYLECETSLGTIAILGSERSRWNIGVVEAEELPFEAVMFCVPAQSGAHAYWVPEETTLFFPAI
ncbi:hypothetical protein EHF33_11270 [Deinococcus psychrotolerans]|uniref:Uncharacterized protein n=1 Tax=Deinococcus psychrotolerans TaxID=2489213 RepID=A0A3G8YEH8_9DEIO|nr:hypothetical protein [Deinococcus psychrotolerans]AZI43250.1 hypothetical protein EHF33_11270 [Deinococcus psychrotolerans]